MYEHNRNKSRHHRTTKEVSNVEEEKKNVEIGKRWVYE